MPEYFPGRPFGHDAVILREHDAAIGKSIEGGEVVGGEHDGFSSPVQHDDEFHQ